MTLPIPKLSPGRFYGRASSRFSCGGMTFQESEYQRNHSIPLHAHVQAFFCLVLEGVSTETCEKSSRQNGPLALAFHPAGEVHANQWQSRGRAFHIELASSLLERLPARRLLWDRQAGLGGTRAVELVLRLHQEFRRMDDLSPLAMEGLGLELLVEAFRANGPNTPVCPPDWLSQVTDMLHDRFAERVSLSELAECVGISRAHLARAFRHYLGCTIGEYVRKLRVDFARRRLLASSASVAEIALEAGFSDQTHLTKIFKRQIGVTPAAFRGHRVQRNGHTSP